MIDDYDEVSALRRRLEAVMQERDDATIRVDLVRKELAEARHRIHDLELDNAALRRSMTRMDWRRRLQYGGAKTALGLTEEATGRTT